MRRHVKYAADFFANVLQGHRTSPRRSSRGTSKLVGQDANRVCELLLLRFESTNAVHEVFAHLERGGNDDGDDSDVDMPDADCWARVTFDSASKKYAAVFVLPNGRQRTVRFGTGSNYVSNPRKTARDRAAYIARHRVNENHNDPLTPGALSRWLLWGESRSLARNTAAFRRRFRLQ